MTNTIGVHPALHGGARVLILLALGGSQGATNAELGSVLGIHPDVIGRHARVLETAGLVVAGERVASGVPWSLAESGRAQRALLLAQAAGVL